MKPPALVEKVIVKYNESVTITCPYCGNAASAPKSLRYNPDTFATFSANYIEENSFFSHLRMTCKNCNHEFDFDPRENGNENVEFVDAQQNE